MADDTKRGHERWAHLRFSIVGPLLASPPPYGEIGAAIAELANKTWLHPHTGKPVRFSFTTIERWYYRARAERIDPVGVLRRQIRKDAGQQRVMSEGLKRALLKQYREHQNWSYQLQVDNLGAQVLEDEGLGPMASYSTVLRFMKAHGMLRQRRLSSSAKRHGNPSRQLERREVRSFEAEYVRGLWHLDFHHGSRKVLTPRGEWATPMLMGLLDDRSRLVCHVQWYLAETAEHLVHALIQAILKRGLPRALMTDNGSAMMAVETVQGLSRLGIVHETTLPYSPHQNGKQECFWGQVEGRLIAMLDGCEQLTLGLLNEATQAWVELEYNRAVHSETREAPVHRFQKGPDVGRPSPSMAELRDAFTAEVGRTQRRSDGTVTIEGVRYEIPARYQDLEHLTLRYASWDLGRVLLIDGRTGTLLCPVYPLDRAKNANGMRRSIEPAPWQGAVAQTTAEPAGSGVAPLLRRQMREYAATGLPPAYLLKDSSDVEEDKDDE